MDDTKNTDLAALATITALGVAIYGVYKILNQRPTRTEDDDDGFYRNVYWGEVSQTVRQFPGNGCQDGDVTFTLEALRGFSKKENENPKSVLNDVISKYTINSDDKKRRVKIIKELVEETLIKRMKNVDPLFRFLYNKIYFTGSYYDGLRCTRADEFDLNILLSISEIENSLQFIASEPGFVKVKLANRTLSSQKPGWIENWDNFLSILTERDSNYEAYYLNPKKIRSWFQKILSLSKIEKLSHPDVKSVKIRASGPAWTLNIQPNWSKYPIDVDLVPAFQFQLKYLGQTKPKIFSLEFNLSCDNFFIIPKEVRGNNQNSWRLDFHDSEKLFLGTKGYSKNVIKLLKVFRDANQELMLLSSYALKTLVMLMIRTAKFDWSPNNLPELFIQTLECLKNQLEIGRIPYLFDNRCDVLWSINKEERMKMSKFLRKVIPKLKDSMNHHTCREVWSPYFHLPTTRS